MKRWNVIIRLEGAAQWACQVMAAGVPDAQQIAWTQWWASEEIAHPDRMLAEAIEVEMVVTLAANQSPEGGD